jgi:hypothetical protein
MKRTLLIACLTILSLVAHPRPASAGWWAWLEEFSGPGPFKGKYPSVILTFCFDKGQIGLSPLSADKKPATMKFCLYADESTFEPKGNANAAFPRVDVDLRDFGAAVRLNNWLDVGAGVGRLGFNNATNGLHNKFAGPVLRVVFRPLVLIPTQSHTARQLEGILNVYFKETMVGPLNGADFGQVPSTFASGREVRASGGFILDLTALLGVFK